MKILISGASGLVGKHLMMSLTASGHTVNRLVRRRELATGGDAFWNPASGEIDQAAVANSDAIVNLAGESIAGGRWTAAKKRAILDSRVQGTNTIARALAQPNGHPKILINASAIGYYGNRGESWVDELSASGSGDFLSDVCRQWEAATEPAARGGARVVMTRFGVILSRQGGALAKMMLPFKLGLGGVFGSGRQYMSWVTLDDVVDAIVRTLVDDTLSGPVNVVSPHPVTNYEFTKTLGRVLRRPTLFPMPAFAAKLVFGEMGEELLLSGQRVKPAKLLAAGYEFSYPELEAGLRHVIGRPQQGAYER